VTARVVSIAPALICLVWLASISFTIACTPDDSSRPTITSLGFDIAEVRVVEAGIRAPMRLRIEAPSGVEALRVRERSYDVDLARSPEVSHFPLFGLSRRVWSKTDVTLDFGPYVATKIESPGEYTFGVLVTDRDLQTTEAILRVNVTRVEAEEAEANAEPPAPRAEFEKPPIPPAEASGAMRRGEFQLERVGAGPVVPGENFGITWSTTDSIYVVIRLRGSEGQESRFARLDPSAFKGIDTQEQLAEVLGEVGTRASLDITTANAAAAGTVFAIVHPQQSYLLLAEGSETSLSDLGTTVTLSGQYKN
jgi:hypothetical protein